VNRTLNAIAAIGATCAPAAIVGIATVGNPVAVVAAVALGNAAIVGAFICGKRHPHSAPVSPLSATLSFETARLAPLGHEHNNSHISGR